VVAGQQHRRLREARTQPLLLGSDLASEVVVDGDQAFPGQLVVPVAQVGGAMAVADDAVEGQRVASPTRNPVRIKIKVVSRLVGSPNRARLSGCSIWAMTNSGKLRGGRLGRLGKSSG
jgi:hypothetical protein